MHEHNEVNKTLNQLFLLILSFVKVGVPTVVVK